jgi:hypothetical protein
MRPNDLCRSMAAAALIKKYGLIFQRMTKTKGGPQGAETKGVELRLSQRLGAHDLTVIKVNDVSMFRDWVNGYFRSKGLPLNDLSRGRRRGLC